MERARLAGRRLELLQQGHTRVAREMARFTDEVTRAQQSFQKALNAAKDERRMHAAVAALNVDLAALRGVDIRRG
jgi:MoxR-like ATPase